jgi:hypothetical protein
MHERKKQNTEKMRCSAAMNSQGKVYSMILQEISTPGYIANVLIKFQHDKTHLPDTSRLYMVPAFGLPPEMKHLLSQQNNFSTSKK